MLLQRYTAVSAIKRVNRVTAKKKPLNRELAEHGGSAHKGSAMPVQHGTISGNLVASVFSTAAAATATSPPRCSSANNRGMRCSACVNDSSPPGAVVSHTTAVKPVIQPQSNGIANRRESARLVTVGSPTKDMGCTKLQLQWRCSTIPAAAWASVNTSDSDCT
jgi:hypothetical protein